jgi:hypothetical protein
MNAPLPPTWLPFALPDESDVPAELPSRRGYFVTTRSRIDDMERQASLEAELDSAPTPDEQERILAALDALRAEQEADERRAQEEADAKYDEENARW